MRSQKCLLVIQYGDFAEAYEHFAKGGQENFKDQMRSVDYVCALAPEYRVITYSFGGTAHRKELMPGVFSVSDGKTSASYNEAKRVIREANPTHVLLRTPSRPFCEALIHHSAHVFPMFADLFTKGRLRGQLYNMRIKRALRRLAPIVVSNHSLNASMSLHDVLGVSQSRIVPWDFEATLPNGPAKTLNPALSSPTLFFAGSYIDGKGLPDLIKALALLKDRAKPVRLRVAGRGDDGPYVGLAATVGVSTNVDFLGLLPLEEMRQEMAKCDAVVVPSRRDYPEGFPGTLTDGIASRSPVIMSDHPAFQDRLGSNGALIFKAGDAEDLASRIQQLFADADLYAKLSARAEETLAGLTSGIPWNDLIDQFLRDPEDKTGWVTLNSLAQGTSTALRK